MKHGNLGKICSYVPGQCSYCRCKFFLIMSKRPFNFGLGQNQLIISGTALRPVLSFNKGSGGSSRGAGGRLRGSGQAAREGCPSAPSSPLLAALPPVPAGTGPRKGLGILDGNGHSCRTSLAGPSVILV